MKNIILAAVVIIACMAIGQAMGNQNGGFIVGVVFAIMLAKRESMIRSKKSA